MAVQQVPRLRRAFQVVVQEFAQDCKALLDFPTVRKGVLLWIFAEFSQQRQGGGRDGPRMDIWASAVGGYHHPA